jgi:hypothetical protein
VPLGSRSSFLDDLICPLQEGRRDAEAERFRRLEVDGEVEPRGLLDGKVGGLGPFENPVHEVRGAPELIRVTRLETAPARFLVAAAKAPSSSPWPRTSTTLSCSPRTVAAASTSLNERRAPGNPGSHRTVTRERLGTASLRSCRRLPVTSVLWTVTPVMLPPGRARLATKPVATGSLAITMTMGIDVVALCAAAMRGLFVRLGPAQRKAPPRAWRVARSPAAARTAWLPARRLG